MGLWSSRLTNHVNYVSDRMMELHNQIVREFLDNESPDFGEMEFRKKLLLKYQRRLRLIKIKF